MKHLVIFLSVIFLSTNLFAQGTGILYLYKTSKGLVWKKIGNDKIQAKYNGAIQNGKPEGIGNLTSPDGDMRFTSSNPKITIGTHTIGNGPGIQLGYDSGGTLTFFAGQSATDFIKYTAGTGVTIGHGLGKAPAFYIHKTTGDNSSGGASQNFTWHVYHKSLGATKAMFLIFSKVKLLQT